MTTRTQHRRSRRGTGRKETLIVRAGGVETVFEPKFSRPASEQGRYFDLVHEFPLRHLRNEKELDDATEVMRSLVTKGKLSRQEHDYLDVLADIIERYETEHHPIPDLPPREFLGESIRSKGITQTELSRATGISTAVISNILAGRRDMTLEHVRAFARYFHYSPTCFIAG